MSIAQPSDGHGIYDDVNPDAGQGTWGPRLDQIASGGFKVVINYGILYGHTSNMLAYINYAASKNIKVGVALHTVWTAGNLATMFPTMYVEAGSPGATAYNAFATHVVNQVKALPGTWGYYLADEPQDPAHTNIKSLHDAIVAADATKPILIICDSDTATPNISNFWAVHNQTWTDCCTVGGDDFYPIGLTNRIFTIGGVSAATQSWCNSNSVKSAIVLQGFDFGNGDPSLIDMQAMLNQCLAHMQPQIVLWFGYYFIWGGPGGAYAPVTADPNASTLWANLCRAIGSVPSRYVREVMLDTPIHGYRLDDPLCFTNADDFMSATAVQISPTVARQQASLLASDLDPSCGFNGVDSALTLDTTGFPTGNHAFSMECWVKATTWPGSGQYPGFVTMGTAGVGGKSASLTFDGDAQRLVFIFKGMDEILGLAAPVNGATYHLVGSFDGAQARFYINGALQQPARNETFNLAYGTAYIGRDIDGWNFTGLIKDVWIYNIALSPARILARYNAGMAIGPTAHPLGNGKFGRLG